MFYYYHVLLLSCIIIIMNIYLNTNIENTTTSKSLQSAAQKSRPYRQSSFVFNGIQVVKKNMHYYISNRDLTKFNIHQHSQFQSLLTEYNQPQLLSRRWSGQWDPAALESLRPHIARCRRKQIKAVLGHIGRITQTTTSACWRRFAAIARELNPPSAAPHPPPPLETHQLSTIDWDPRLGEDHG